MSQETLTLSQAHMAASGFDGLEREADQGER